MQIAPWRWDAFDDGFQDFLRAYALFCRSQDGLLSGQADDILDLLHDPLRISARQVDLVDYGNDIQIGFKRQVEVSECLRLDALGSIDHQQGAFAGGQAA